MQLSILQSRLAASVIASCLLIVLYLTLFSPHFALAAELGNESPVFLDIYDVSVDSVSRGPLDPTYEPEFSAFDRSIIGRAPAGVSALTNNEAMPMNVLAGTTQLFMFTVPPLAAGNSLELRDEHGAVGVDRDEHRKLGRRQAGRTVYISANTCEQPQPADASNTDEGPPQLRLYVSTTAENEAPGPLASADEQVVLDFNEGAVMYNLSATGDVFVGVFAPNVSSEFEGTYNFRIAASTTNFFYSYNVTDDADLIWVDSDAQGALLITHNLTETNDFAVEQQIMSTQPYVMFAHNKKDKSINGLKLSYCGLQNHAQIAGTKNGQLAGMVSTGMTKRGPGNLPKQQFFFSGLNSSADYVGILARDGNSSVSGNGQVGGGGHVFKATAFSTKSDHGNCAIVVDLDFCDQVAYSVPSNPNFGNATVIAKFYDDYAKTMYDNFNKSLAQIACEAPSTQRYSLARNCSDCAAAYKDWLCSVTIPRCEDFDNPADYLQPRNMAQPFPNGDLLDEASRAKYSGLANTRAFNSSRNPRIDEFVKPGPYKEVLPCEDLCYNIVQSCPSSLGFSCPRLNHIGFSTSYGMRNGSEGLTCNYQGSAHTISAATRSLGLYGNGWAQVAVALAVVVFGGLLL
ncbi:hypothetical protein OQA88_6217 [Cercophora sp. LCS_1]